MFGKDRSGKPSSTVCPVAQEPLVEGSGCKLLEVAEGKERLGFPTDVYGRFAECQTLESVGRGRGGMQAP